MRKSPEILVTSEQFVEQVAQRGRSFSISVEVPEETYDAFAAIALNLGLSDADAFCFLVREYAISLMVGLIPEAAARLLSEDEKE